MPQLYISKGTYLVTAQDILDTLAGGSAADGNLRWKSGTLFYGILDHANTGDRTYTFPNASGQVALLSNPQTWTGLQTFNTGTIKVTDLLFQTGTRSISQTGGEFQLRTESGSFFVLYLAGVAEYAFTNTTLDLGQNILSNVALIQGVTSNNQIDDTTSGWIFNIADSGTNQFRFAFSSTNRITIDRVGIGDYEMEFDSSTIINYNKTASSANSGGSSLPANPDGFLIIRVAGSTKKVPYYAN